MKFIFEAIIGFLIACIIAIASTASLVNIPFVYQGF